MDQRHVRKVSPFRTPRVTLALHDGDAALATAHLGRNNGNVLLLMFIPNGYYISVYICVFHSYAIMLEPCPSIVDVSEEN